MMTAATTTRIPTPDGLWGWWSDQESRHNKKYHLKALVQSVTLLLMILGVVTLNAVQSTVVAFTSTPQQQHESQQELQVHRRLQDEQQGNTTSTVDEEDCDLDTVDPGWVCVFYTLGVLYMFLALAISCDEFFVPALEEMSSKRQLNLSMDVAGATLMAAGGSAPELFSSLFGTFAESEIGFGTIIGSAVFNVLFVIAMCSLFSKETLSLTWWPLFRDSFCYAIGLLVLVMFVGVNSPEEIELWEAAVLFAMYFAYIGVMWKNADIYHKITGKVLENPEDDDDDDDDDKDAEDAEQPTFRQEYGDRRVPSTKNIDGTGNNGPGGAAPPPQPQSGTLSVASAKNLTNAVNLGALATATEDATLHKNVSGGAEQNVVHMRWQGTFRAGILKLLRDPEQWITVGGMGIVAKIAGDADYVFKTIDADHNGFIDKKELRQLFVMLQTSISNQELDEVFAQLDTDGDGTISEQEFNAWYTNSKELIRSQVRTVFDELDTNHSGTLDKGEVRHLLVQLDPSVTEKDVADALEAMYVSGTHDEIRFDEFAAWYEKSILYERQKQAVEEDMLGVWENLKPPVGSGCFGWVQYIVVFPLVLVMAITVPDVRRPGMGKWCYLSFILSIAWIGAFSYLMVTWTELVGNTLGIPSVILGLTVLAAGTSVPDLLSSVIVARRGNGDMAVSSSIGSNIFDILVGLPVPWLLFTAWPSKPSSVSIGADNIGLSISLLLGMLVFVIAMIHCQGWKLTKALAAFMLWFYFAFLCQAIILEIPFETC
mmetsp:Transcript_7938/g.16632  ORF Transcript_7938/g.16632 Transcript_7938/m.16632 type:complete len:768 (+) Transcript_7938:234-2537(+)|eukprot:CAMPEP_0168734106 /NCGR_PEP_ID=MMETSP0724-20121128/8639_1 /TAXON_ID=265536 /ORGANISM="Amphiprora sp., Strain CCMP467" /LENGTH=767 /DNA_ID=CAMNT_0008781193 /DNA_START=234 /DNA_END=2537 /DNA_ORIENTATION=+